MKFKALVLLASIAAKVQSVSLNYPFNDQYPPVARYGEEYNYQLPGDTFTSGENINYWADGLPSWLKFDTQSLTLSGTPPSQEASLGEITVNFNIHASDSTGEVASPCSLILTTNPEPIPNNDALIDQLKQAGPLSGADSLVLNPGQQFVISIPQDFYREADGSNKDIVGYTALMDNHTPLPNWLSFNPAEMKFIGFAPAINSQIAPAQTFHVSLIVINYEGFTSATTDIDLVIGAHQFTTNVTSDIVNATAGKKFTYQIPFDKMSLDHQPVQMSNISAISLNNSDWLEVDNSTGKISGTPPKKAENSTSGFQVDVTDKYGDTLNYVLSVNVGANSTKHSIFTSGSLGVVNATQGEFFQYSLKDVLLDDKANVSASFDPPASWVKFNSDNNTFVGQVPKSFKKTKVTLTGKENSDNGDDDNADSEDQSSTFTLTGVKSTKTAKNKPSESASASPTSSSTASAGNSYDSKTVAIVCGTVIPICVLAAAIVLFLCIRRNRKANSKSNRSISPPILPDDAEKNLSSTHSPGAETVAAAGAPSSKVKGGTIVAGGAAAMAGLTGMAPRSKKTRNPSDESNDSAHWDTPQKVLAMNFMKMDSSGEDLNYHSSDSTHVGSEGSPSTRAHTPNPAGATPPIPHNDEDDILPNVPGTPVGFKSPVMGYERPASGGAGENVVGEPRNSWRQPEQEGRWQEHKSVGSLATISTDELLTMRLVDRQSAEDGSNTASVRHSRNTYMSPTKSRILTPHQSAVMVRDDSSGNIKQIGSHSSSVNDIPSVPPVPQDHTIGSYSESQGSLNQHHAPQRHDSILRSVQEEVDGDIAYYRTALNNSHASFQSEDEDDSNQIYKTASSGSEFDESHSESDNEHIRPYRNSRGEMTWSQYENNEDFVQGGHAVTSTPENKTRFSFVPHTGQTDIDTRSSRQTVRVVDAPERRSTPLSPENSSLNDSSRIQNSSSAEVAFL